MQSELKLIGKQPLPHCERSRPSSYRTLSQSMARQVCDLFPQLERFVKFVDYGGYFFGRLDQEQRKVEKQQYMII